MKTSYLFVAALLLTALASCSRIQTEGGTKTLKDGTVYAGCTDAQGRPHGYGQLTKGDSTLYEGQWNHARAKSLRSPLKSRGMFRRKGIKSPRLTFRFSMTATRLSPLTL